MFTIILIITLLVYSIWRFGTRNFGCWKEKGVKHDKPVFLFGNMYNQCMKRLSPSQQISEWYNKFPGERYVGVHLANDLGLVLRDPELIKHVLVTDFKYFYQRGLHAHKRVREPIFQNLFSGDGDLWKMLRQHLTPAFSSAKVKAMFPLIERTAEKMLAVIKAGNHDVRELMARYTTDFIGSCGFGLDFDSLNEETSMFRRLGKRAFHISNRDALAHMAKRVAPELFKHVDYLAPEIWENTSYLVKQILNNRNYAPSGRNDFIDLLLDVKQKGKMSGESLEHFNSDGSPKIVEIELDDKLIVAQVFVFFAAGFETSSTGSSFLLHELAFHTEIQEKCHKEIDEVLSRHSGKISYDAIKNMKYLQMAFKEALRLHPPLGFLLRKCARKYTFPGTTLTIDEDVYVLIPLQALHNDPSFIADPDTFKPERFHAEAVNNISKYVYMPFGEGPRSCIGERLGVFQSLAGVTALLSRFRVEPAPTSRRRPLIDPSSFVVDNVLGGLPLTLVPREPGCNLRDLAQ